jgi:type II secretory pathway component PulF
MVKFAWPNFASCKTLSADEVAELAARIGQLTRAGMPLGEGLRAVAGELPGRRLTRTVRRLADRFDAGDDAAVAMGSHGGRIAAPLPALMLAGVRTGRLAEVLEEYVSLERGRGELRRRLWRALAYPLVLLVMLAGMALVASVFLVPALKDLLTTVNTELSLSTGLFLAAIGPATWVLLALAVAAVAATVLARWTAGPAWLAELLQGMPLVGPLLRLGRWMRFSRLLSVLLEYQVPLPEALRLTAAGLGNGYLGRACRRVAAEVETGRPLAESMRERPQFPPSLIPLLEWGQRTPALAAAFRAAAEMYQRLALVQATLVESLLLPITLLLIMAFVGIFISAIMVPMFEVMYSSLYFWGEGSAGFAKVVVQSASLLSAAGVAGPILLGIAILVAQRWIAGDRRYHDDVINVAIGMAGWILIVVGLGVLGIVLVGQLAIYWLPWELLGLFVLIAALRKRRARQQDALLWALVASAERGLPLTPAIRAFALEPGGRRDARRAGRLAAMLTDGMSLPDALERSPGLLPPHVLPLVRIGCESGALAPALRQAAATRNAYELAWMSLLGKLGYLCLVPAIALLVFACLAWWIFPELARTCEEIGTLPPMAPWMAAFVDHCLLLCSVPTLLLLGLLMYALARYLGWLHWDLPGLGRLARRDDTATILDGLALAAAQDRPVLEGIQSLAESSPKRAVRRQLHQAAAEVDSGGDWCEGLFHHGLIGRADRAILQAAQRLGNLPWALREMADSNRRRLAYRVQALSQMCFPLAVFVYGAIVGLIAVAVFSPLTAMIYKLS